MASPDGCNPRIADLGPLSWMNAAECRGITNIFFAHGNDQAALECRSIDVCDLSRAVGMPALPLPQRRSTD